ncbi:hypothetical protein [Streptomyces sp. NPDC057694]|uniref:hypothetical protein n=1 Tax=Streptomyces sp. NPDC057694 TaxID=3346216 RepID=UPI00367D21F3
MPNHVPVPFLLSDLLPAAAIGTLGGERQGEEVWFRYHLVDVRTGTPSGELTVEVRTPYELLPMGDGSWLTDGSHGHPVR